MRILLFSYFILFGPILFAQNVLSVGVGSTASTLESIIEAEGLDISSHKYEEINAQSLADKDIVALFNLRQTWNKRAIFSQQQAQDLIAFVEAGGRLYLTARKGYSNLLVQLGVVLSGNDGGPTGRDWPLILKETTVFKKHPITAGLSKIQTDVSARFELDKNWDVLAKTNDGIPMLAIRHLGAGQIILGTGERTFRDPRATHNRYETDIEQADNYQYHQNLFRYLKNPIVEKKEGPQIEKKEVFQIFPNPTTQDVTIIGDNILSIDVINVQGQILRREKYPNVQQVRLNLGDLAPALYFLKIQTTKGMSIEEVIIKKL